jgi:hypothetical protein
MNKQKEYEYDHLFILMSAKYFVSVSSHRALVRNDIIFTKSIESYSVNILTFGVLQREQNKMFCYIFTAGQAKPAKKKRNYRFF